MFIHCWFIHCGWRRKRLSQNPYKGKDCFSDIMSFPGLTRESSRFAGIAILLDSRFRGNDIEKCIQPAFVRKINEMHSMTFEIASKGRVPEGDRTHSKRN